MTEVPQIHVELLGIPRKRSGCDSVHIPAAKLGELLRLLGERFPQLEGECLQTGTLMRGYLSCLNGQEFTNDPARLLKAGDTVIILSSDVGG
ncbi:MAG: hypothetical protein KDA58_06125 [Planctomycetaceae bacterium]|nr:hypothetical protein [Planctomycetaceae bacterium]